MTNPRFPFFLLCLLLWQLPLHAADNDAPPPPPYVADPRVGTRWELRAQAATSQPADEPKKDDATGEPATPPNRLDAVRYQIGAQMTSISLVYTNGQRADHYLKGDADYVLYLPTKQAAMNRYVEPGWADPFVSKGFPGMNWLSSTTYAGVEPVGKAKCWHFHRDAVLLKEGEAAEKTMPELDAWINVEDKVPVKIRIDGIAYLFTAAQPAEASIDFPSDLKALVQRAEKELHALELMRQPAGG